MGLFGAESSHPHPDAPLKGRENFCCGRLVLISFFYVHHHFSLARGRSLVKPVQAIVCYLFLDKKQLPVQPAPLKTS